MSFPFSRLLIVPVIAFLLWAGMMVVGFGILGATESARSSGQNDQPLASLGQLGDMFGSLNSLFSAVALTAAICAAVLQNSQLQQQRSDSLDQRLHDEEGVRREKLEALLRCLHRLREKFGNYSQAFAGGVLSTCDSDLFSRMGGEIMAANSEARMMARLYFRDDEINLHMLGDLIQFNSRIEAFLVKIIDLPETVADRACVDWVSDDLNQLGKLVTEKINYGIDNAARLTRAKIEKRS